MDVNLSHILDFVHWLGIAGGAVAVLAGFGGLTILLFLRKGPITRRMRVRTVHMAAGATAALLALAHGVGRAMQAGGLTLGIDAPHLTCLGFFLVVLSGLLRNWPPGFLQERVGIVWWIHRAAVLLLVCSLLTHVWQEISPVISHGLSQ